ncbi:hypothetical protein BCV72DRAFT_303446 [Rhizopus microsporus var. microsporus]|uniref:Uncharacterized protein n=2 Tax=Rhizopus microsporus TaxID=58291 RepID=A0A2G4T3S1_RHIZD|nr:uncharacterized protein RHIMIDRAFT_235001 [Rhizopus microsporus ATCC 52813]ORE08774.1 hypothetical protein BCV72DRAFT_303446 [Rhizopus microsporus var. microsporus]PHZ15660.1 hypothetical protein RHIMIDRAFT_235001 [Rhizopus microsporus ATCC 52813]
MEQTNEFDLNNYVVKGFFVEVFLSVVHRLVHDGTITKMYIAQVVNYTPPKLVHAQQMALYECTKIQTAYFNNIKA